MSDYHRIYMKLADLLERGHCVQIEKRHGEFEVTVFEPGAARDHNHTSAPTLTDAMEAAHAVALRSWPHIDD